MSKKIIQGDVDLSDIYLTVLPDFLADVEVKGNFYCDNNPLTTLKGAPQTVGGHVYCSSSQLTTLEGAPQTVEGDFNCCFNKLTTLKGAPQTVEGDFICLYNPVKFTEEQVRAVCDVKGSVYV